jgi:peptidyl-prolyl cis-trans isomerase B (cyclophilin B)
MVRADYTQQVSTLTTQSYNSATSQFMILDTDATELNGLYAAFGEVVEGTEIIDELYSKEIKTEDEDDESTGTEYNATTINAFDSFPAITNITVETYGVDYGLPETHEAFDYSSYLYQLLTQYYSNY